MDRKKFIELVAGGTAAVTTDSFTGLHENILILHKKNIQNEPSPELSADVVICGGGLGGCAAALASLRNNLSVILTEETAWIGGQISQQGVPPDEHQWIETHGGTRLYREFRSLVRNYYRRNYPLTETASRNKYFNPGDGSVSRLCHEPRVALAVLLDLLAPFMSSGKLILLSDYKISEADFSGDKIRSVKAVSQVTGKNKILSAPYFIDATELGDLLPLTKTEFITGSESRTDTGELHAPEKADPENNQAFTMCFAIDYIPEENNTIEKPGDYYYWKNYIPAVSPPWPGKLLNLSYSNPSTLERKELGFNPDGSETSPLLNLWNYRRIINKNNFKPSTFISDISLVNWPQNDYIEGNLIGASPDEFRKHIGGARQLSLSLLYWLQTEAPRHDKGYGWPGLRLRNDIMGTEDGLAKYPYIRESRRIKAMFRVTEEHVGKENRALLSDRSKDIEAADFYDSVGTGYYHIDLHPSTGGNNYIDFPSLPFQIPLGALIPQRVENLIPANKNIGTTHITNGCYRLHPVEWNIGESAGKLIAFSHHKKILPRQVRQKAGVLKDFQSFIRSQGIETHWPKS
jgi:hypothetical protein